MCTFAAMESTAKGLFTRTARLLGEDALEQLENIRVIIFGIGGVGSWVAEALIRSGVQQLTIVDRDCVDVSNVNRQCPATVSTIGQVKVIAMKSRLLEINPQAKIQAIEDSYDTTTRDRFHLEEYDYIVDAIDSLSCKAALILHATSLPRNIQFFSSMGAAMKMDAGQIRVEEFWKAKGCPLARALRQYFKRHQCYPSRKFTVVYSPELLPNKGALHDGEAPYNGSLMHITAAFGLRIAGEIIQNAIRPR